MCRGHKLPMKVEFGVDGDKGSILSQLGYTSRQLGNIREKIMLEISLVHPRLNIYKET